MPLLPDAPDQNPLAPPAVEFATEDTLLGVKVEPAVGHHSHDFAAHDLPLQACISVIFTGATVEILAGRCLWGQLLPPLVVILVQTVLSASAGSSFTEIHLEVWPG